MLVVAVVTFFALILVVMLVVTTMLSFAFMPTAKDGLVVIDCVVVVVVVVVVIDIAFFGRNQTQCLIYIHGEMFMVVFQEDFVKRRDGFTKGFGQKSVEFIPCHIQQFEIRQRRNFRRNRSVQVVVHWFVDRFEGKNES